MKKDDATVEWPTLLLLMATYIGFAVGTTLWDRWPVVSIVLTAWCIAQFSSLQHEALHGHPFRNDLLNEALVFPALAIVMPYRRFKQTHLQHHFDPALTDPYDDPETQYLDPTVWKTLSWPIQNLLLWNNTLFGRIVIGPAIGMAHWIFGEARLAIKNAPGVRNAWALNFAGLVLVILWLSLVRFPPLAYAAALYLGMALLRIRTFLEHRAHEVVRARTVIVEDRGPLALLFLNNNLHAVHHMHPQVAWYRLPSLYRQRKDRFCQRTDHYIYASYAEVFRRYLFVEKEPVSHPLYADEKPGATQL